MPALKTILDPKGAGHFLSGPNDPNKSNEQITLAITAVALPSGTVLGMVAANSQYKPLDPAAVDGSQNFAGILFAPAPISAATQKAAAVCRDAVANGNLLTYVVAVNNAQRLAAEAQAAAKMVMIRR